MPSMTRAIPSLLALASTVSLLAGCGSSTTVTVTRTVSAPAVSASGDNPPAIAQRGLRRGEVRFAGEGTGSVGPERFGGGIYTARFEQYAPEDPTLDFRTESSSIVIQLNRRPGVIGADTVTVVNATKPKGSTKVTVPAGRWYADVSADHRFVVRFTP